MEIKAIETIYKGYRFRSRLEARWAVFFEEIGVIWNYEQEGYEVDGIRYLPDFVLSIPLGNDKEMSLFIEIKPNREASEREIEKAVKLSGALHIPVLLFSGDPYDAFHVAEGKDLRLPVIYCGAFVEKNPPLGEIYLVIGALSFEEYQKILRNYGDIPNQEDAMAASFIHVLPAMIAASEASQKARAARFEFGEAG